MEEKKSQEKTEKEEFWEECLQAALNANAGFEFKVYERQDSSKNEFVSKFNLADAVELLKQFKDGLLVVEAVSWRAGARIGFLEAHYLSETFNENSKNETVEQIDKDLITRIARILFTDKYPNG